LLPAGEDAQATAAPGADRGQRQRDPSRVNVHTLKQKTPLTRGHAMPEVGLKLHSSPRKHWTPVEHAESDPIRPIYDSVRHPKCGQCTHPNFIDYRAIHCVCLLSVIS
jgi:hypothetical protein